MGGNKKKTVLEVMLEKIELPPSAYEKADKRYQDLGEWFEREDSQCTQFSPHIFSQGSFRLGTANKPDRDNEYDLDMACKLQEGLAKDEITQKHLKKLVGDELELYREARGIKEELSEKQRCWRIEYADDLSFHMDIVPCIPENQFRQSTLTKRMIESSMIDEVLAREVAQLAVSITDNEDEGFDQKTDNWRISNPEGYARWFEVRMKTASQFLSERETVFNVSVDTLPYYQWKTPLQGAIQLLKRHRDTMFKDNDDAKPISVIITTLAAKAYNGEGDLGAAITNILSKMESYVNVNIPYVPNPVNPDEDFADKWYSPDHDHCNLRESFRMWLIQASSDFSVFCSEDNSQLIVEAAESGLDVNVDEAVIEKLLGVTTKSMPESTQVHASNPRPWFKR